MAWNFSTPDWQNRIRTGQSLIPDLPLLDKVAAERAVNVFDRLRLPDVTGKPLLKEAAGDWFRDIVRALHGSIVNGERMVREPFLLVPKKSSKTSYGAALMLTSSILEMILTKFRRSSPAAVGWRWVSGFGPRQSGRRPSMRRTISPTYVNGLPLQN
jgi:phage terminase large subunit-like protein